MEIVIPGLDKDIELDLGKIGPNISITPTFPKI
jgi:hypothetical protein